MKNLIYSLSILLFSSLVFSCGGVDWSDDDNPEFIDACTVKANKYLQVYSKNHPEMGDFIMPHHSTDLCACLREDYFKKEGISKEEAVKIVEESNWDELEKLLEKTGCWESFVKELKVVQ